MASLQTLSLERSLAPILPFSPLFHPFSKPFSSVFSLFAGHVPAVMSRLSHRQQKVSDYTQAPPHRHVSRASQLHPSFTQPFGRLNRMCHDVSRRHDVSLVICSKARVTLAGVRRSEDLWGVHWKHLKLINGIQYPLKHCSKCIIHKLWNWHCYPGIATPTLVWGLCFRRSISQGSAASLHPLAPKHIYNSGRELLHLPCHCQLHEFQGTSLILGAGHQAVSSLSHIAIDLKRITFSLHWAVAARSLLDERRTCSSQNQSV